MAYHPQFITGSLISFVGPDVFVKLTDTLLGIQQLMAPRGDTIPDARMTEQEWREWLDRLELHPVRQRGEHVVGWSPLPGEGIVSTMQEGNAPDEALPLFDGEKGRVSPGRYSNTGHGHVYPRIDGVRMRCGSPGFCDECNRDFVKRYGRAYDKTQTWKENQRGIK